MLCINPQLAIFKSVASANAMHLNLELISFSLNPPCVSSFLIQPHTLLHQPLLHLSLLSLVFRFSLHLGVHGGVWRSLR